MLARSRSPWLLSVVLCALSLCALLVRANPAAAQVPGALESSEAVSWHAGLTERGPDAGITLPDVIEPVPLDQAGAIAAHSCDQVRFTDHYELILTDAHLISGGTGTRLCLVWDDRWGSYLAILLNHRTAEEFRDAKGQLQPLLALVGVDSCEVAFWTVLETALRQTLSLRDRQDAGRRCEPEVIAHGPLSEARTAETRDAIARAVAWGEETYRWPLTWPLRLHLYDDHDAFVEGVRREAGNEIANAQSLSITYGVTTMIANGMMGVLLDASSLPRAGDLAMLTAHEYAHIAQTGALGSPRALPFFAYEGGAEYFASLVVGPDAPPLVGRFRAALADERSGRAVPLTELLTAPRASDPRRLSAGYSRGYAAMRFLAARWGPDAFSETMLAAADSPPARYLEALARVTGLPLDAFDRALGLWLREQVNDEG